MWSRVRSITLIAYDRTVLNREAATPTSGNNVIKPLMLLECLNVPHHIEVVNCQADEWFTQINPLKMVPALQDTTDSNGVRATVFESSACLRFVAEKYDTEGRFSGRTTAEKAQVSSWLAMHNAGLGYVLESWTLHSHKLNYVTRAQAKWWLTLKTSQELKIEGALAIILAAIKKQYTILDGRLGLPGQKFVALPDRATIADFATLPFANEKVASVADIDLSEYPRLKDWSERMFAIQGIVRAYERVQTFGHVKTCNCNKV
jgi:glutathione S-transferase